jgi:hypothetical protein
VLCQSEVHLFSALTGNVIKLIIVKFFYKVHHYPVSKYATFKYPLWGYLTLALAVIISW